MRAATRAHLLAPVFAFPSHPAGAFWSKPVGRASLALLRLRRLTPNRFLLRARRQADRARRGLNVQEPITLRFRSETEERVFINQLWLGVVRDLPCARLYVLHDRVRCALVGTGREPARRRLAWPQSGRTALHHRLPRGPRLAHVGRARSRGERRTPPLLAGHHLCHPLHLCHLICARPWACGGPPTCRGPLPMVYRAPPHRVRRVPLPALGLQIEQRCAFVGSVLGGVLSDRLMDEAGRATGPPLLHRSSSSGRQ